MIAVTEGDIHNRSKKTERTLDRIEEEKKTSQHNINLILQFKDYLSSQNLSQDRISRYLYTWRELTPHLDFQLDDSDQEDLVELVGIINQNRIKEGRSISVCLDCVRSDALQVIVHDSHLSIRDASGRGP